MSHLNPQWQLLTNQTYKIGWIVSMSWHNLEVKRNAPSCILNQKRDFLFLISFHPAIQPTILDDQKLQESIHESIRAHPTPTRPRTPDMNMVCRCHHHLPHHFLSIPKAEPKKTGNDVKISLARSSSDLDFFPATLKNL